MTTLKVLQSSVSDGSMYNRHDDHDTEVIENRRRYFEAKGIPFGQTIRVNTDLLHRTREDNETNFCRVVEVNHTHAGDGIDGEGLIVADAIVTAEKSLPLMLPVADCVGAVLFDPTHEVLMLSHLGRHSLEQQGAVRSVEYLIEHFNSTPEEVEVWLSPAAGKDVYPIWALDNQGMKEVTLGQLEKAGIIASNIHDDSRSTTDDETLYSYSEFLKGHRKEDGDHMIAAVMQ